MKTLYYCFGGGLGHLTRFVAWCHTTRTRPVLLTNCQLAATPGLLPSGVRCIMPAAADRKNCAALRNWVSSILEFERPQQLIVDAFPAGILGELSGLPGLEEISCVYLARVLKLDQYRQRIEKGTGLPRFSSIVRLEKLTNDHEALLAELSCETNNIGQISNIRLIDPPCQPDENLSAALPGNFDLIIHAGSASEIRQLYQLATETAALEKRTTSLVLVTPGEKPSFLPDRAIHLRCYPATWVIEKAQCVFSAAGFNIMRQMSETCVRHEVMPFDRALDDQFYRAASCSKLRNSHFHATPKSEQQTAFRV